GDVASVTPLPVGEGPGVGFLPRPAIAGSDEFASSIGTAAPGGRGHRPTICCQAALPLSGEPSEDCSDVRTRLEFGKALGESRSVPEEVEDAVAFAMSQIL